MSSTNDPTVAIHQTNHALLESLRTTSANLDARIKSTISQLATTRKDLLALNVAPPAPSSGAQRSLHAGIDTTLLLTTAQRIAKYTTPPKSAFPAPGPPVAADPIATASPSSPAPAPVPTIADDTTAAQAEQAAPGNETTAGDNAALTTLTDTQRLWLDPSTAAAASFTPWPSDERIRAGALGRLQKVVEGGGDAETEGVVVVANEGSGGSDGENEREKQEAGQALQVNGDGESSRAQGIGAGLGPGRSVAVSAEEAERRTREQEERRRQQEAELAGFELFDPDAE